MNDTRSLSLTGTSIQAYCPNEGGRWACLGGETPLRAFNNKSIFLVFSSLLMLMVAEPASAHPVVYSGSMTLTGNAAGTSTVVGYGPSAPSGCTLTTSSGAQATASGGSVGMVVAPTPANASCPTVTMPQGTYTVYFLNVADPSSGFFDCIHSVQGVHTVTLGSIQIDSAGNGSGTYALPNRLTVTAPNGAVACFSDRAKSNYVNGLAANLTIVP